MIEITKRLRAAGIDGAEREARKLYEHFSGAELEEAVARRVTREPMSHILGYRDFWRDRFIVSKDVLDPRPDSELFIELALEGSAPQQVLDLGCGSGALGLSVLREFRDAQCVFVDVSNEALNVAKSNAAALGLLERASFIKSDWLNEVDGKFNLILCNPPYITEDEMQNLSPEVLKEPPIALTPGHDGLASYRQIAKELGGFLDEGGVAHFEHGFEQQGAVMDIFTDIGFNAIGKNDINQKPRIVTVSCLNNY